METANQIDLYIDEMKKLGFSKGDDISISIIQRKCKVGYNAAYRLLNYLISQKLIVKNNNSYSVL